MLTKFKVIVILISKVIIIIEIKVIVHSKLLLLHLLLIALTLKAFLLIIRFVFNLQYSFLTVIINHISFFLSWFISFFYDFGHVFCSVRILYCCFSHSYGFSINCFSWSLNRFSSSKITTKWWRLTNKSLSSKVSTKPIIISKSSKITKSTKVSKAKTKWIVRLLLIGTLFFVSKPKVEKVIVIIKSHVFEEIFENIICIFESESTIIKPKSHISKIEISISLRTFETVLIINFSFLGIWKNRISFTSFFKYFLSFFLWSFIFIGMIFQS